MCEKEKESDLENVEANGGVGVPHGSDQQLIQHLGAITGPSPLSSDEVFHMPDKEQWSRAVATMSSRGGLVLA